jgi:hypothetical protein
MLGVIYKKNWPESLRLETVPMSFCHLNETAQFLYLIPFQRTQRCSEVYAETLQSIELLIILPLPADEQNRCDE